MYPPLIFWHQKRFYKFPMNFLSLSSLFFSLLLHFSPLYSLLLLISFMLCPLPGTISFIYLTYWNLRSTVCTHFIHSEWFVCLFCHTVNISFIFVCYYYLLLLIYKFSMFHLSQNTRKVISFPYSLCSYHFSYE